MKTRLTPFSKLLIVAVVIAGLVFAAHKFELIKFDKITGGENSENDSTDDDDVIKIGVVTWGGYVGGQYFNKGFKANAESRFYKDYGFKVEFRVLDDFDASREAWKADQVHLLWATIDAFTTEVNGLKEFEPQVVFQADWSRGGDAVVARRGIKKVEDLKGKSIAFASMTPSNTFLLWLLDAGNLSYSDIKPKIVPSAIDAADLFKKGQVDAAVVWSPDDADCVAKVSGATILQNTKQASHIIADVFVVKKAYLEKNRDKLEKLYEGWMIGASEINSSDEAKQEAAAILSDGLNQPLNFCVEAINNVRLCTNGDNINFYNLNGNFGGVTGEDIYNKMEKKYRDINIIDGGIPSWRLIGNPTLVKVAKLQGEAHAAEKTTKFTKIDESEATKKEAVATKGVPITFRTGEWQLDENAKYIVDNAFLDLAKSFANARIRIEGNTDNVGARQANINLSKKRAQSVVDYLVTEHRFDVNRFVVIGNGPDKPVADNNSDDGRSKNRRTDFEIIPN